MKKIIVSTDFSAGADTALAYALSLAREYGFHLVLFRAYQIPMPPVEVPAPVISAEVVEPELYQKMEQVKADHPDVHIEIVLKQGDVIRELQKLATDTKPVMVVMGMRGAGKLSQLIIGSNTTAYMRHMKVPLLVVPLGASYNTIRKIALAADSTDFSSIGGLHLAQELALKHHARISVLNFNNYKVKPLVTRELTKIKLEQHLHDVETVVHFEEHDDIVEGITSHVEKYHSDLLIMVPHQHSFLERLLGSSNTESMAYKTRVPLLALPEKKVMETA